MSTPIDVMMKVPLVPEMPGSGPSLLSSLEYIGLVDVERCMSGARSAL